MKRILAVAAAAAALAVAAPASAEPQRYEQRDQRGYEQNYNGGRYEDRNDYRGDYRHGDYRHGQRYDRQHFSRDDIAQLQARIDWGVRSGRLNRYESRRLNWQLADLRDRSRYYWRTDGISWRERRDLEARYDSLRYEIRRQISDDDYGRRGGYRG